MYFKKTILFIISSVIFCNTLFSQEVLDKIIAIVGDNIILQSELFQYSYTLAMRMGIDPQSEVDKMESLRKETLKNLIVQKVLLVKAKEDSILVSDKQVDMLLEDQIKQMIQQAGSEEQVEKYFGMTVRQIRREFRKEVEERLLVDRIKAKKDQDVHISRREVEAFYKAHRDSLPELKESVKIRHILIPIEASQSAETAAREKIEAILERLKKGEDFQELARQFSEDPGSADKGGNLGVMERGDLVKEFEEVAFALEPGQISDIVKTRFGFHIIQLIKKTGEKINPRHILIRLDTSPDDESATVSRLNKIRDQILAGEITFSEAAKQYSKDEPTASRGGDLGWFQIDQFQIETFKKAIVGLKKGDISQPVKTKFGYHLIWVEDRKPARRLDIKEDWEQIESWALNMKRQREFQKWVEDIKKDIYIEIKI
ncbi:MAG: peptidylprolyl isomerase [bacterium]